MTADTVLLALGLVFVLEGLLPLLAPDAWRRAFTQMLQLRDGQLRFFGLVAVAAGLALLWLVP
ncbi:MAG TPA: DUF2065 family protein [Ottowia sp.]|uniref:DUF2065 domain-containing protein n=1 Tax=Ottowia sp. TaxID=1898956 RepID=UPI002B854011|nr:DUF2065 family protein [Ottowia sp.]HMN21453.1 DUF2065 family protein [Ottowia sp.]